MLPVFSALQAYDDLFSRKRPIEKLLGRRTFTKMGSLTITYQQKGKKPLSVAIIHDPDLLRMAAQMAISEAQQQLEETDDPVLARLQSVEVARLRSMLEVLIPGLSEPTLQLQTM